MNRLIPSSTDTLENPVKYGHMITCWQNGRRVLMHSSEVARMMKGARRACAVRANQTKREESEAVDHRAKPAHDEVKETSASHHLSPPPIRPRNRALANNTGWQTLAKEMARAAKHPLRCHKKQCRRTKKCEGGVDACYLREFEAVDVVMQENVLPLLRAGAAETS